MEVQWESTHQLHLCISSIRKWWPWFLLTTTTGWELWDYISPGQNSTSLLTLESILSTQLALISSSGSRPDIQGRSLMLLMSFLVTTSVSMHSYGLVTDITFQSYRKIASSQKLFTVFDFFRHFTPHRLYAGLQGASIFRRGLPDNHSLQIPSVAHVFRTALRENVIADTMFPEVEESAALKQCFAQGWLHTDKGVLKDGETAAYFFASSLHRLFVEWKLFCRNLDIPIQAPNLLEFEIQIIKRFSPLNFPHPRTVGPYYFQTVPEAQYQDEFYRCCYGLTAGSLTTLSEFGTADGRVNFYIPSKNWGVELLRDGQCEQHHNNFSPTGRMEWPSTLTNILCLTLEGRKLCRPTLVRAFHLDRSSISKLLLQILHIYSMWCSVTTIPK